MKRATKSPRNVVQTIPVVVVGAGPAGAAASRALAAAGCRHLVLERGGIGRSWQTQRWDSFRLNTPRWANRVPGPFLAGAPDSFATRDAFVGALRRFADGLPVVERVEVLRARALRRAWRVETSLGELVAGEIVVASGFQNVPRTPGYAGALPHDVSQLHAADYRRPEDHGDGVLVVGGGQSGLQIAEDLLDGGRRVFLATSRVGRLPRRHRGRDAYEWQLETGLLDMPREDADEATIRATPPQVSGGAGDGRTVSYQRLAARGATLLGRAVGVEGRRLLLGQDLGWNVLFADKAAQLYRTAWEKRVGLRGASHAPAEFDPADRPAPHLYGARGPASLDLAAAGISTVIWATGFAPSTGWLPAGALDGRSHRPRLPGLHVIGAPWVTHRSSGNLYGMVTDADRIARTVTGERRVELAA
jgi:putative flavoprotein involved in K+ transport